MDSRTIRTCFHILLSCLLPSLASAVASVDLVPGWNLSGNSEPTAIDVAARLGDSSRIVTVWKWDKQAMKWVFYTPLMTPSALSTYAQSKGYDVLTSIEPKDGFWVNALVAHTAMLTDPLASPPAPGTPLMTLLESDLPQGWSLVSSADNKTPSQLNASLSGSLNAANKAITTTWAWDAPSMKWRFFARTLEQQGGTIMTDYIVSKGYLPFSTALTFTDGFWMNIGASGGVASAATNVGVTKTCAINGAQSVLCTVTVTNNGSTASVSPLSLTDVVSGAPTDATYIGAGGTLPISCTPGAGPITPIVCSANVSLAPAESKYATFSFNLPQGGTFTNCATVLQGNSATQPEANSADNTNICATITVPAPVTTAGADLVVTKSCALDPAHGPQAVYCAVTVHNNGTLASGSPITVTDTPVSPPAGTLFTSSSGTFMCNQGAGAVPTSMNCTYNGSFNSGTDGTTFFYFNVPQGGTFQNCASATQGGSVVDPNPANNTNICASVVVPAPSTTATDLTLTKTAAITGNHIVYTITITITNLGTTPPSGVIHLSDLLSNFPAGTYYDFGSGVSNCTTPTAGTAWDCEVPLANLGQPITIGIVLPAGSGSVTNCATVSLAGEANTQNNQACVTSVVGTPTTATLTIAKHAVPNDAQNFAFYASGPNSGAIYPFLLDDDAGAVGADATLSNSKTFSNLVPGSYTVSENFFNPVVVTGWDLASITCTSATGATVGTVDLTWQGFTVDLAAGDNVTCTFINVKTPASGTATLTIVKDAQPNDAQNFAFYAFGPNSGAIMPFLLEDGAGAVGADNTMSNSKTFANLVPGSYSVKEDFFNPVAVTGWNSTGISCTLPNGTAVGTVDMSIHAFTVSLAAGDNVTCKFTNTKAPPVSTSPDLSITKTSVVTAQGITYTITVTNNGTVPTVNPIVVIDTMGAAPANSVFNFNGFGTACALTGTNTATCTSNAVLAANGGQVTFNFGFLIPANGASSWSGTATNCATLPADSDMSNNQACVTNVVPAAPTATDLTLTKTAVITGNHIVYTITITNLGTTPPSGVIHLSDLLSNFPAGTYYDFGSGVSNCTTPTAGTAWNCEVPLANLGQPVTIGIVLPAGGGSVTNCATVSLAGEANTLNNQACVTNVVPAAPTATDLTLTKTAVVTGNHIVYTITITNLGTTPPSGVIHLSDLLSNYPAGTYYDFGSGVSNCTTPTAGTAWDCEVPLANLGQPITIGIVLPAAGGSVTNCATVSLAGEANTQNNQACVTSVVGTPTAEFRALGGPTLQVSKIAMIPTSLMTPVTFMSTTASGITTINVVNGPAGVQFDSILTSANSSPGETLVGAVATLPNSIALVSGSPALTMSATSCGGTSGGTPCTAGSLVPLSYADFGVWAIKNVVGNLPADSLITYSAYAGGSTATTSMTMPTSGTATYTGKMTGVLANTPVGGSENVSGDVTVSVSFSNGSGTITALNITNIVNAAGSASTIAPCVYPAAAAACTYAVYAPYQTPALPSSFAPVTLGTGSFSGSSFNALVSTPSVTNATITVSNGHFYGPAADEIAGTFTISKPSVGTPSQGMIFIGSFGAK